MSTHPVRSKLLACNEYFSKIRINVMFIFVYSLSRKRNIILHSTKLILPLFNLIDASLELAKWNISLAMMKRNWRDVVSIEIANIIFQTKFVELTDERKKTARRSVSAIRVHLCARLGARNNSPKVHGQKTDAVGAHSPALPWHLVARAVCIKDPARISGWGAAIWPKSGGARRRRGRRERGKEVPRPRN